MTTEFIIINVPCVIRLIVVCYFRIKSIALDINSIGSNGLSCLTAQSDSTIQYSILNIRTLTIYEFVHGSSSLCEVRIGLAIELALVNRLDVNSNRVDSEVFCSRTSVVLILTLNSSDGSSSSTSIGVVLVTYGVVYVLCQSNFLAISKRNRKFRSLGFAIIVLSFDVRNCHRVKRFLGDIKLNLYSSCVIAVTCYNHSSFTSVDVVFPCASEIRIWEIHIKILKSGFWLLCFSVINIRRTD